MKKTIILVDGQNLFYTLQEMGVKEKDVNWTNLFNDLIDQGDEFIRAYWFRPERLKGLINKPQVEKLLVRQKFPELYEAYKTGGVNNLSEKAKEQVANDCEKINDWIEKQQKKFESQEYAYDQLCLTHNNIEIVKAGITRVNAMKMDYLGEKGVDIALAVKMMALSIGGKCDKIILISGDYDYVPAIRFVKDNLTKLNVVRFTSGLKSKNMSSGLPIIADKTIDINEADLKGKYRQ